MAISNHAATFTKALKLIINIVVVVLYRNGDEGYFMGASYNKNHDAEALACGVFIGYLIYTIVCIVAFVINSQSANRSVTETLMNFLGAILWLTTGGVVIQFWLRFIPANHFTETNPTAAGVSMGILAVINAAVYGADTVFSYRNYANFEK